MSESVYEVVAPDGTVVNTVVLLDLGAWMPPVGHTVRPRAPAPDPGPDAPRPRALDEAALIDLCQAAGGMSDAQLVAADADPALRAFWIKLRAASAILPTDPRAQDGLAAVEALGYLPAGAAAVLAAWPTH